MSSRIDEEPNRIGNRCFEMHPCAEWDETHRFWIGWDIIEPIIAKGNVFDGVEARY